MATRARGDVLQSPYVSRFADYLDRAITITINFNNSTRVISNGSVTRDAGCLFSKLLVGLGGDGNPDHTDKTFDVPFGTTAIPKAVFTNKGFNTIEEFQALQITAGL